MIPNREGCHYLTIKKWSALLSEITSKHEGDINCLNCLHSFRTKIKLKHIKKICENKNFDGVIIPSEDTKIVEFNQYQKSDKTPSIIYADHESWIKKVNWCKNNIEK